MPEVGPRYHLLPETYRPQACFVSTCERLHGADPRLLQGNAWPEVPVLSQLPPLQAALAALWRRAVSQGGVLLREALTHLLSARSAAAQTYLLYHLKQQEVAFEALSLPQAAAWATWAVKGMEASWEELVAVRYGGDPARARARGLAHLRALEAPAAAARYPQEPLSPLPVPGAVDPQAEAAALLAAKLLPLLPEENFQRPLAAGADPAALWAPRGGFELLAAGRERNVFLHRASGLVFKSSLLDTREEASRYERLLKQEAALSALRATYCRSAYVGRGPRPLLVQEYLSPELHRPFSLGDDLDWRLQGQEEALGLLRLTDLHRGNVVYRPATRQAVLFDCLYRPSSPARASLPVSA